MLGEQNHKLNRKDFISGLRACPALMPQLDVPGALRP